MPFFVFPRKPGGLLLILLFFAPILLSGQEASQGAYPRIVRLNNGDTVFKQYTADVANARRLLAQWNQDSGGGGLSEAGFAELLTIYSYTPGEEDLLSLAARCNVPYAALATLNRMAHPASLKNAGPFLLPSVPGLFIPENPGNDLEMLLGSYREGGISLTVQRGEVREHFRFFPGADLNSTERTFFLTPGFRFPLKTYRLTSAFGPRINPVTGNLRVHQGLDMAAPLGADVYATREGVVAEQGEDPVYGKYIILRHTDNWASLYGHLSQINTVLHGSVRSGTIIGKVGSTGQSTGPHLHFELRRHGKAQDPGRYLFREGGGQ